MTSTGATVPDAATLLVELTGLSPDERPLYLRDRASGVTTETLLALGDEAERMAAAEVTRALEASDVVVHLADLVGNARTKARARRARAQALAYAGRFDEALDCCLAAEAIAMAGDYPVEAARGRLASVHALASLGRFDEAIAAAETARAGFLAADEPALAARADLNLGAIFEMRDNPARALVYYDRAREGLADEPVILAQLQTNRGIALTALDDFTAAEEAFRTAVPIFEGAGLNWAAALAEGNLAYLALRQGRLERALRHFENARRCFEQDESPAHLARLLAEQAEAYAVVGLLEDARTVYERALSELEVVGFQPEAAQARSGLGRVLARLGRFAEAEAVLDTAAASFDGLEQPTSRAMVDLTRAQLAARRGDVDGAAALLVRARAVLRDRPVQTLAVHQQLAQLALAADDLPAAIGELQDALTIAERLDLAPALADLLHLRAVVHRGLGDDAQALSDLRAAVQHVERVRGTLQAERFRTAFLGNRLTIYEDLVVAALERADEASKREAFETVELAKSRALLDLVSGAFDLLDEASQEASDPSEAALLAEVARLDAELNWLYSQPEEHEGEEGQRPAITSDEWQRRVHALEAEFEGLQSRIAAVRGVAGLYARPLDLVQVRRLLPADAALIEYFVAGDELMAFVLHRDQIEVVRRLGTLDEVTDRAQRLQFQLVRALAASSRTLSKPRADRLLEATRRELAGLDSLLMAPLRSATGDACRLIVVPHGPLHAIPFHALWDGERYLVEAHEVVYAPSASMLGRLATTEDETRGTNAVVVGVPDVLAPQITHEVDRVAAALATDRVVMGAEATAQRVTDAMRDVDIVHLACHGRFSVDTPLSSGLKLADRWLSVRDIFALRLRADLVTLSACETGRNVIASGDELVGLMRGFFAAGASSVLVSLWTVNDESTVDLMTEFYAAWKGGATKPAALRAAQRAHLAHQEHPAFWAPFVLGGKP